MAEHEVMALVEEALDSESVEDLVNWTLEDQERLDDDFFAALDALSQAYQDRGEPDAARGVESVAAFVRSVMRDAAEIRHQNELFRRVLEATTYVELQEVLQAVLPEIREGFFWAMGRWADESRRNNEAGINLCQRLLDQIEFNDLREDWEEPARTVIWCSAWFVLRDSGFARLFEAQAKDAFLDYETLQDFLRGTNMVKEANMEDIGLAMLNVLLEASPRAVFGSDRVSQADEFRFEVLTNGARLINARARFDHTRKARRVLKEAQAAYERVAAKPLDAEQRAAVEANASWMLGFLGDLALDEGDPEEAERLHRQRLERTRAAIDRAQGEGVSESLIRSMAWGVPNALRQIAYARIRLWQLDEAYDTMEQAISEYRRLGMGDSELAGHLEAQARIEFLRANFAQAEALLDAVASMRQETRGE